jgi:Caspase domain
MEHYTSSDDGRLRLYRLPADARPGTELKPLQVQPALGGTQPFGVAFSPDGQLLAVGYVDSTRVDVLDGATLAWRVSPDTKGVDNGNLSRVAFSKDGRTLAAAGRWGVNGRLTVRRWPNAGQGQPQDTTTAGNTIMSLVPLPQGAASGGSAAGGWLVGARDPAWGQLQADGIWRPRGNPPTADLRGSLGDSASLLGDSGRVLQFGYEQWGKPPHQFDLRQRRMLAGALPDGQPPRTSGLKVEGWINTDRPTLNGQPLKLENYEVSRSLALLPDASGFALGADYSLRLFNADGSERWPARTVPGTVWGVNIPQTGPLAGKVIVAAYGDGTVRWHRVSDGAELLAFFPHADRQRWVLWTPSGYYDASPGAEDLIGWHLNRGADAAADFFPIGRFRQRFNRPDVIDRVLDTLDEAEAVRLADQTGGGAPTPRGGVAGSFPPAVDVLTGTELTASRPQLRLQVRGRTAADAPVTGWSVRVNGLLAGDSRGATIAAAASQPAAVSARFSGRPDEPDIVLTLPPEDAEVEVFAENRFGLSPPALVRVKWTGPRTDAGPAALGAGLAAQGAGLAAQGAKPAAQGHRPRLFVLAVGVSDYQHRDVRKLALAAKDARDFVAALKRQQGKFYGQVKDRLLVDQDATRDEVMEGMAWLQIQATAQDVAVMFIAGHGMNDGARGYAFLPVQANPERLFSTGVPASAIRTVLGSMRGRSLFFFDTCHSGGVMASPRPGQPAPQELQDVNGVINDLGSAENAVTVFSSCGSRQLSLESREWGNGAFTRAVIEGLDGKAAELRRRPEITRLALQLYVSDRVKELTRNQQSPEGIAPGPDFAIAMK